MLLRSSELLVVESFFSQLFENVFNPSFIPDAACRARRSVIALTTSAPVKIASSTTQTNIKQTTQIREVAVFCKFRVILRIWRGFRTESWEQHHNCGPSYEEWPQAPLQQPCKRTCAVEQGQCKRRWIAQKAGALPTALNAFGLLLPELKTMEKHSNMFDILERQVCHQLSSATVVQQAPFQQLRHQVRGACRDTQSESWSQVQSIDFTKLFAHENDVISNPAQFSFSGHCICSYPHIWANQNVGQKANGNRQGLRFEENVPGHAECVLVRQTWIAKLCSISTDASSGGVQKQIDRIMANNYWHITSEGKRWMEQLGDAKQQKCWQCSQK